jgi:hypothetical protein
MKLTTANEIERSFGGLGSGRGKLENPSRIRIDADDHVYILDGATIVVYDVFGNYIRTIGDLVLKHPSVFTVDQTTLFILDSCSITAMNEEGEIIGSVPVSAGITADSSCAIRDIAIAHDSLYILTEHHLSIQREPSEIRKSPDDR